MAFASSSPLHRRIWGHSSFCIWPNFFVLRMSTNLDLGIHAFFETNLSILKVLYTWFLLSVNEMVYVWIQIDLKTDLIWFILVKCILFRLDDIRIILNEYYHRMKTLLKKQMLKTKHRKHDKCYWKHLFFYLFIAMFKV